MVWYVAYIFVWTFEDEFYLHYCRIQLFPSNDALLLQGIFYSLNEQLNTLITSRLEESKMYLICILIFPEILSDLQYQELQLRQVCKVHIENFDHFEVMDLSLQGADYLAYGLMGDARVNEIYKWAIFYYFCEVYRVVLHFSVFC